MAYIRKTRDYWEVQTFTGQQYGWECATAEDSFREARERLKEYRENQPEYRHRLTLKRERIEAPQTKGAGE